MTKVGGQDGTGEKKEEWEAADAKGARKRKGRDRAGQAKENGAGGMFVNKQPTANEQPTATNSGPHSGHSNMNTHKDPTHPMHDSGFPARKVKSVNRGHC